MTRICLCLGLLIPTMDACWAQDEDTPKAPAEAPVAASSDAEEDTAVGDSAAETPVVAPEDAALESDPLEQAKESANGLVDDAKKRVGDMAKTLDQNPKVQKASTSILEPIYQAARAITFPAFYWVAFALMAAGVVSYAFQLVLGKLVVLTKGSFNIREILSDAVGLSISAIGLVLTTQAATDNSTFADSPSSVLSAAGVGVVAGLILYRWNQTEEVDAAHGRQKKKRRE